MGLHSTVYVMHNGDIVGFGPGDDLPEDVARQIGAHAFEDGIHPYGDPVSDGPPPKAGAGSSTDAWAKYAADNGVDVEEGASRDAIISACSDVGVSVDPQ